GRRPVIASQDRRRLRGLCQSQSNPGHDWDDVRWITGLHGVGFVQDNDGPASAVSAAFLRCGGHCRLAGGGNPNPHFPPRGRAGGRPEHRHAPAPRGALGVTTLTRFELLPDVPPIADAVPGYEASSWVGIVAPRGAPAEIVETLNREINAGLIEAKVKARMREIGHVPMPMGAVEFGKFIAAETEFWGKVIRAANIKPE